MCAAFARHETLPLFHKVQEQIAWAICLQALTTA